MHSSRMRTVRCSGHLRRGESAWGGEGSAQGGLSWGVCSGGVCSGGGVDVSVQGLTALGGACLQGFLPGEGLYIPCEQNELQTDRCINITFPQVRLLTVKMRAMSC